MGSQKWLQPLQVSGHGEIGPSNVKKELGFSRWNMRELKIIPILLSSVLLLFNIASAQWEKIPVPTTASLRGLSVVSENTVWASGTGGAVLRTVDGGKTWS